MAEEGSCTYDEDTREWTVIGPGGRKIVSDGKPGVDYKIVVEGSSRPPQVEPLV